MSEPVKMSVAESMVVGKCLSVRKAGETFFHLVAMPAPDPYSHPSTVEVAASERLAEKDGEFRSRVRIKGFARQFKTTDRDTGEQRTVRTADVKLEAVV